MVLQLCSSQRYSTTYVPVYLEDPDGFACYWHHLRKELRRTFSRQHGGYLMVRKIGLYNKTKFKSMSPNQHHNGLDPTWSNRLALSLDLNPIENE
ncbi:hypothetical protein AVEN_91456-1 [Araneus ventricosus]|uniref:Uncharacterized protein n=1 Tax=Araneus ventricosus TaxID=182803 RepID=A0A4Y2N6B4_ARAVE|nr:hypothetical protein AVEN_91456-1 [Araneus ventricosus]